MNISEMHVWFRQYAQQMGMQNVRAILPEQIDLLINTSIVDTVNQIITQTIGVTNDRIITDSSKIGQINALKPLYKIATLNMFGVGTYMKHTFDVMNVALGENGKTIYITITVNNKDYQLGFGVNGAALPDKEAVKLSGLIYTENLPEMSHVITDAIISRRIPGINDAKVEAYALNGRVYFNMEIKGTNSFTVSVKGDQESAVNKTSSNSISMFNLTADNVTKGMIFANDINLSYMYLVDFSIDYKTAAADGPMKVGTVGVKYASDAFVSKYYPVRLVDDAYLADTLNDYILSPRPRSPIITVNANTFDLYFGDFIKYGEGYTLINNLIPYTLRVSYIAKPCTVKYAHDVGGTDVDCDLPDYLHIDILKHAVDLWRNAVGGNQPMVQGQGQPQQGGNPNNESYNS